MKAHIATLIMATLVLPLAAQDAAEKGKGKGPKGDPAKIFAKLDADSDGLVSKQEFAESPMAKKDATKADAVFAKKDKDGDGKLSKEEFAAKLDGDKRKKAKEKQDGDAAAE